jgi:thioredoxin reductase (NADPH)
MNNNYDVLIIGCGPAGIGCALELKKNNINFAIIEKSAPGGKINIAPRVDNYPGFKEIPGPALAMEFYKRVLNEKIKVIADTVNSLTKVNDEFILECNKETYVTKAVLIASGTTERKIGLEKEVELQGKGISYCSICDGHFFRNKDVVIVGGGNSALKEAVHLAKIVNKLYVVHRRNEFRGSNKTLEELTSFGNVEIITPFVPVEILGEEYVTGLVIKNRETEELRTLKVDGFFPLVGQDPNTQYVHIEGVLDEWKTITFNREMKTNTPGLFASGDVFNRPVRQIYLAEHDGKVAAKGIVNYLKGE